MDFETDSEVGGAVATKWVGNVIGAVICMVAVGIVSSMFMGFLTLDVMDMQIKIRAAVDAEDRRCAKALLPIIEQNHRLLVTLLILNCVFYEALPIFLNHLIPDWAAVVVSVTILLLFGEIIPMAIFAGPNQLKLASQLAPLMNLCLFLLHPITYPLVKLVEFVVPPSSDTDEHYDRGELTALLQIQHEQQQYEDNKSDHSIANKNVSSTCSSPKSPPSPVSSPKQHSWADLKKEVMEAATEFRQSISATGDNNYDNEDDDDPLLTNMEPPPLHSAEVRMAKGALNLRTKVVMDIYTDISDVFCLSSDTTLTKDVVTQIYNKGYNRIPIYLPPTFTTDSDAQESHPAVCGFILTRHLWLLLHNNDESCQETPKVSSLTLQIPPCASPRMNLVDLLLLLQKFDGFALVCAHPHLASKAMANGKSIPVEAGLLGIVTTHDIYQSLLPLPSDNNNNKTNNPYRPTPITTALSARFKRSKRNSKPSSTFQQFNHTTTGYSPKNGTYSTKSSSKISVYKHKNSNDQYGTMNLSDIETGPLLKNGH